jgi:hypothetical protein
MRLAYITSRLCAIPSSYIELCNCIIALQLLISVDGRNKKGEIATASLSLFIVLLSSVLSCRSAGGQILETTTACSSISLHQQVNKYNRSPVLGSVNGYRRIPCIT